MLEEIERLKMIDNHTHMFGIKAAEENPFEKFTLTGNLADAKNTMVYHRAVRELANLFSCKPEVNEILKVRRSKVSDFKEYVSSLFEDAGIDALIVDPGFPPTLTVDEFRGLVPVNVHCVFRVDENLYDELLDKSSTFDELLENYSYALDSAVKKHKIIALKSIIGYFTGLHIKRVDENEAEKCFNAFKEDKKKFKEPYSFGIWHYKGPKKLRDFLFWKTLKKCRELNIPIQIHTGDGDIDMKDLSNANPLLLHHVLNSEEAKKVKIIMLHAGYPFVAHLSHLTNLYPNVYIDTSYINLFTCIGLPNRLVEIFEMAPFTRILYGSDAFQTPEMHWLGAKIMKRSLREVFIKAVKEGVLDETQTYKVAEMIFFDNAKKLYRI